MRVDSAHRHPCGWRWPSFGKPGQPKNSVPVSSSAACVPCFLHTLFQKRPVQAHQCPLVDMTQREAPWQGLSELLVQQGPHGHTLQQPVGALPFCGALSLPGSLNSWVHCSQCACLFAFKQASCEAGVVCPHPMVPGPSLVPSISSRGRQTRTVRDQVPPPAPMPLACGLIWGSWALRAGETGPLGTVPGWTARPSTHCR